MNHFNFLVLRTPVLPLRAAYSPLNELPAIFREGLYLASKDLYSALIKHEKEGIPLTPKQWLALRKYWLRSSTRCTPFGSFAGTSVLKTAAVAHSMVLNEPIHHYRRTRIDMDCLFKLVESLLKLPAIQQGIKYHPNNSLYKVADTFRYADYQLENQERNYQLISVPATSYLEKIIGCAAAGANKERLISQLLESIQVSPAEAATYIEELIESQVLIAELEPRITGQDPLQSILEIIDKIDPELPELKALKRFQEIIDQKNPDLESLVHLDNCLASLIPENDRKKHTLQSDLVISMVENELDPKIPEMLLEQVSTLFQYGFENKKTRLEAHKALFGKRYEQAEIPLSLAMDADLGIGYGFSVGASAGDERLLKQIDHAPVHEVPLLEIQPIQLLAARKYCEYLKEQQEHIEIHEADLRGMGSYSSSLNFPESMYLTGSLFKTGSAGNEQDYCFHIKGLHGPSAANLLGRFTQGCPDLQDRTKAVLREEASLHPDKIYAEIVHLPQTRLGNILQRPVLRDFEIPYLGISGAEAHHQISIQDLMLSLKNGKFILRSIKHNKQVIPRMSTAHNYTHGNLPLYQFLCDLQSDGLAFPMTWNWGTLYQLRHLPRVIYKNLILHKAKWRIELTDIETLPSNQAHHPEYFKSFCQQYSLPFRVVYSEADHELLIDFRESSGIDLFLYYLRLRKQLILEEFLFAEETCVVHDSNGHGYANELILPFQRKSKVVAKQAEQNFQAIPSIQRCFPPGSPWLYFKIYCGNKTGDKLLTRHLLPFIESGIRQNLFEQFFFIRYFDEAEHIRIRFYNQNSGKQQHLQHEFLATMNPLLEQGFIHKVLIDTYEREVERFGYAFMEVTEQIFYADSLAVLRVLNLLEEQENEKYRILLAMRGIDRFLESFELDLREKRTFSQNKQSGFFQEFGGSAQMRKQLNEQYRLLKHSIFSFLDPDSDQENDISEAILAFKIREEMIRKSVAKQNIHSMSSGKISLQNLVGDYIHMFINRMFLSSQRKYELLIYHFLEKYYTSVLAIQETNKPKSYSSVGDPALVMEPGFKNPSD